MRIKRNAIENKIFMCKWSLSHIRIIQSSMNRWMAVDTHLTEQCLQSGRNEIDEQTNHLENYEKNIFENKEKKERKKNNEKM